MARRACRPTKTRSLARFWLTSVAEAGVPWAGVATWEPQTMTDEHRTYDRWSDNDFDLSSATATDPALPRAATFGR